MSVFTRRYQKTGFTFALAISFIYLPLLLGVLEVNKFIPNNIINLIIFIAFSTTFITTINYKIILSAKNKTPNLAIKFLLAPFNILIMIFIYFLLPFEIHVNVFIFSLIFLGIPWLYFFRKIVKNHCFSLKLYLNSKGRK